MNFPLNIGLPGQILVPSGTNLRPPFGWKLYKPFKPKPTMLTKDQQRARSRNWIRFKVIQDRPVNVSTDQIKDKVITESEYALLLEINNLRSRLQSTKIQFLEQYRRSCEFVELPKPPEKKVITEDIIDGIKTTPW